MIRVQSELQSAIKEEEEGLLTKFHPKRKQAGHLDQPVDRPDEAHDLEVVSREGPRGQAGTAAVDEFDCRHRASGVVFYGISRSPLCPSAGTVSPVSPPATR